MQRHLQRLVPGWVGVAGAISAVLAVSALSGCPGTLDPSVAKMVTGGSNGSGGDGSGSGGSTGSGGSGSGGNSSGGSTGSGGSSANCTGNLDPTNIIMTQCAAPGSGCHDTADANKSAAGLDLTVNSSIGSRLVDVTSPGNTAAGSECGGNTEAYLNSGSSPATGLLIQKIKSNPKCSSSETPPCCGLPMPYPGVTLLSTQQQNCLIQWATTLTSP